MRAVFDLDDTICVHKRRDFNSALPVHKTIEKMVELKNLGWEIVIYTARGQNSCEGDLIRIKNKYEKDITEWLEKNNVPFDQLVFGKPLGDIYIDDKGVSLEDFLNMDFALLKGNSGSGVCKVGDTIVKRCNNSWEQYDWYEKANGYGVNTPKVYSVVLDTITMECVDGNIKKIDDGILYKLLSNIFMFKYIHDGSRFEIRKLIERVDEHLDSKNVNLQFMKLKSFLINKEQYFRESASFSHGDYSISNCLLKDNGIVLIDPNQNMNYSSYLLDIAKLKFSLDGGELFLNNEEPAGSKEANDQLDRLLNDNGLLETITALETTHWLRLLKYEKNSEKVKRIIAKAVELEGKI